MIATVTRIVDGTSAFSAALGAALSPIPMADEIVLLPVYAWLAHRIGKEHGLDRKSIPWSPIVRTAAVGLATRAVVNLSVAFIPGVAAVANAASAFALTQVVGAHVDTCCADPARAHALTASEIGGLLRARQSAASASPG